mgnify:FL=1
MTEKKKNPTVGRVDVSQRAGGDQPTSGLKISRLFSASREALWRAWTEPELLKQWHGPKQFTAPVIELDLRYGGKYLFCMRSSDGKDYWSTGTYREIVPNEKLVFTDSFADAQGNVVPGSYYGLPGDFPLEMLVTVTFSDEAGRTRMTVFQEGMPGGQMGEMATQGWNESLDKLAAVVEK